MSVRTRSFRLLGVLAAVLMLGASLGFTWAVADDYRMRQIVPAGVRIAGHDAGGLSRSAAAKLIDSSVTAPLSEPVEIAFRQDTLAFDARDALSVDVDAMLAEAFEPATLSTVAHRAFRRVKGENAKVDVAPALTVDEVSVNDWIASTASLIDSPSVDATITYAQGAVSMTRSATGLAVDQEEARVRLTEALLSGTKRVRLPVDTVEPRVSEADLGASIVVDLSERRLYLYDGLDVAKTYRVAVGAASFPTPKGAWHIVQKRYRPTWGNPGSAWAKDMPAFIPPGPGNPLGTRALNLSASGIRIHGTSNNASIGSAASHGCMRMHRWDIEDLYERVEVGTPVFIVR